jgi:hypothetical protein
METGENTGNARRPLTILIVVIAIGVAGYYLFSHYYSSKNPEIVRNHSFELTHSPIGEIPKNLPADIVQEEDIKILGSYTVADKSDQVQETLKYSSTKNILTNHKLYEEYFTKNNWALNYNKTDESTYATLIAKKGIYTINVTISMNSEADRTNVDITETYIPSKNEN